MGHISPNHVTRLQRGTNRVNRLCNLLTSGQTARCQALSILKTNSPTPSVVTRVRLCIILTCFNRKEKTLACFRAVSANANPNVLDIAAVVVDDGSTDGTGQALLADFPWVQVVNGGGNLYWCRGMHMAFEVAARGDYDYYLWLNDDTMLAPNAIQRLLACAEALRSTNDHPFIVVGSTVDALTGAISYGGEVRASTIKRTSFLRVQPTTFPQRCDSMNGNVVLVPRTSAEIVGNVDPRFEHAMGDTDYALRAKKLGVSTWVGPGVYGTCSDNPRGGTFRDASLPMATRWALMMNRKGLPWRSWLVLTRRHMGPLWILYFLSPYVSLLSGRYGRMR
jgi:GT2 family glycosyltransferase